MSEPTDRPRHHIRTLILIAILLTGGCGLAAWLYAVRIEPPRRDVRTPPPLVETMLVTPETFTEHHLGYGIAEAERSARLAAEIASTVVERVGGIKAGRHVVLGQSLLRFDDREYRHALARATAQVAEDQAAVDELGVEQTKLGQLIATAEEELRIAAAEFERVSGLYERALAAEKELNVAKLAHQVARRVLQGYQGDAALIAPRRERLEASRRGHEASVEMARLNIERCVVMAPFDGVIEDLGVDVGDRVGPGSYLATVIDPSRVEVAIRLPGALYDRVQIGAPCRLESESLPEVAWHGEVARIGPSVDRRTRTFAAYLIVDNTKQDSPLVPGTFLRAAVEGPTQRDALVVPRSAIRGDRVFVVEGGVARARRVHVRRHVVDRAVVDGALRPGDRVILNGLDVLTDGSPVRIAGPPAGKTAARDRRSVPPVGTPRIQTGRPLDAGSAGAGVAPVTSGDTTPSSNGVKP